MRPAVGHHLRLPQMHPPLGRSEVHGRVRDLFVGAGVDETLTAIAIEELENAAAPESEPLPERLAAWLLLRDKTGKRALVEIHAHRV